MIMNRIQIDFLFVLRFQFVQRKCTANFITGYSCFEVSKNNFGKLCARTKKLFTNFALCLFECFPELFSRGFLPNFCYAQCCENESINDPIPYSVNSLVLLEKIKIFGVAFCIQ